LGNIIANNYGMIYYIQMQLKNNKNISFLALCAVIGPLLFISIFTILGVINPLYSEIRQQISVLVIESYGILLNVGFIFGGLLTIVGVIIICQRLFMQTGSHKTTGIASMILLSIPPLGMVICGIFPFNSSLSFMHFIGANLACTFPAISFFTTGLLLCGLSKNWILGILLIIASLLTAFCVYGYLYLSEITIEDIQTIEGGGTLGLWERILAIEILFWYMVLGIINIYSQYKKMQSAGLGSTTVGTDS
jgi:hypothetical protein